ncbi:MAG TPA: acyltransferase, partial [Polyangiaceae bacterium]|nr:acyltransferase [Polyangiaceae bacterium]
MGTASPAPKHGGIPHVPALDGLRGAAVLGVLFFHSEGALPGGYLGVDLFFVLSGYLITSLLVAEHARTAAVALGPFWVRRARRLLPAVLALMPAIGLYCAVWAKHGELAGVRRDALATLGYVANWRAIFTNKSYWDLFAAPSPLEHTWSLAIEEQFYVLWPLACWAALRRSRRALLALSLALAAASVALMAWRYAPGHTARVYLGTDTRASGMLLGAALACVLTPERRLEGARGRLLDAGSFLALALLAVAWARLDGESPWLYRGGFLACELACLTLIAAAVLRPGGPLSRAFSVGPLRAVGNVSYGVYLWHWPIFVVLTPERVHLSALPLGALRFALTFAIAALSLRVLERPIRTRGLPFGRAGAIVPAAFAASFLSVAVPTWTRRPPPAPPPPPVTSSPYASKYSVSMQTLPPAAELAPGALRVLTLGDSVASFLGIALRHRQDDARGFAAERGVGSCTLFATGAHVLAGRAIVESSCSTSWEADVERLRPDLTLIVMGGAFLTQGVCEPAFGAAYEARLGALVDAMGPRAGQVVIALVPTPVGRWRHSDVPERVVCLNAALARFAARRALPTLDLMGHVCPTKECTLLSQGEPVRPDGLHFDGVGAEETAAWTW